MNTNDKPVTDADLQEVLRLDAKAAEWRSRALTPGEELAAKVAYHAGKLAPRMACDLLALRVAVAAMIEGYCRPEGVDLSACDRAALRLRGLCSDAPRGLVLVAATELARLRAVEHACRHEHEEAIQQDETTYTVARVDFEETEKALDALNPIEQHEASVRRGHL